MIVDQDEREQLIREGAEKAAADAGLALLGDEGLVVENAGLTEWPVPLLGRFDADYLDVPREVIVEDYLISNRAFADAQEASVLDPLFAAIDASEGIEGFLARLGLDRDDMELARLNLLVER